MGILHHQLDYQLPPPHRVFHFADQPLAVRWRIEAWESTHLKYAPSLEEIEAKQAEILRLRARAIALAERLAKWRASQ